MSLATHNVGPTHAPVDALNDLGTKPDRGSINLLLRGGNREATNRSYTIRMYNDPVPAPRTRRFERKGFLPAHATVLALSGKAHGIELSSMPPSGKQEIAREGFRRSAPEYPANDA